MKLKLPKSFVLIGFLTIIAIAVVLVLLILNINFVKSDALASKNKLAILNSEISAKEATISALRKEIESFKSTDLYKELATIKNTIMNYKKLKERTESYKGIGINVLNVTASYQPIVDNILDLKFEEASASIAKLNTDLDKLYAAKLEADRKAAEEAAKKFNDIVSGSSGYVRSNVKTDAGTFLADILTFDLDKVRVITDSANSSDCKKDCPTMSLSSYVSRNGGFAGINGTYFCPPDYPACSDKKSSFDFSLYNSNAGKWINKGSLTWDNRALITFGGSSGSFYKSQKSYSTGTGVSAGIAMTPGLVQGGSIITGSYSLTSKETSRTTRSSIGFNGKKVYVVVGHGVTVYELAHIHKAIGSKNAISMDGGGSVAFYYNGSYYVGPGRSLPNAIIFKYK